VIITILLLLLFMITVGLVSIFIFCILIPSITQDKDRVQKFIFASDELKISSHPKKSLEDTGRRAVVLCSHEKEFAQRRINYQGPKDCILFTNGKEIPENHTATWAVKTLEEACELILQD